VALLALGAGLAACGIESQEAPSLIGPSGLAQTVSLNAVPDRLPRDGRSQSVVTITVRNDRGEAVAGQRVTLGSSIGTISQADVVTGPDGRASFTVTAPVESVTGSVIEVFATPVGGNFTDVLTRSVTIALTGPSNNAPPAPQFMVNSSPATGTAPSTAEVRTKVIFDATPTTDEGEPCLDRCRYVWDFGGVGTATGRIVTFEFQEATGYVIRLTVTDPNGSSSSVTRTLSVEAGEPPTIEITFSPANPGWGETVYFDAELSRAAPGNAGRPIVKYIWNFGDAGVVEETSQRIVSHAYQRPGGESPLTCRYRVVLTVVDSAGRTASAVEEVEVGDPPPDDPDEPDEE